MKTRFLILILILLGFVLQLAAQDNTTTLTVNLGKYGMGKTVKLKGKDFCEEIFTEKTRKAVFTFPLNHGDYFTLHIDLSVNDLYLEPGTDLTLTVIPNEKGEYNLQKLEFVYEGTNAKNNKYLNTCQLEFMKDIDFLLDEQEYLKKLGQLEKHNRKTIRRNGLDKAFEQKELLRNRYKLLEPATRYPIQHFWKGGNQVNFMYLPEEETPVVKQFVAKQLIDNEKYWECDAYRYYVKNAIGILSLDDLGDDWEVRIQKRMNLLLTYFKNPRILEDMVHGMALVYIEGSQGAPLKSVQEIYDKYVTKAAYKEELEKVYASWKKMQAGQAVASSDAPYSDIEGNPVSLDALKGKYIYIDVWATWCGPCRGELPYLKKLEKQFEGRNIHFVSISLDARKKDWVKMVEKEQLGGIQLWGGPEAPIARDYNITGIPRFILLDRDGKLINSNMTRPSDAATYKTLESLGGI